MNTGLEFYARELCFHELVPKAKNGESTKHYQWRMHPDWFLALGREIDNRDGRTAAYMMFHGKFLGFPIKIDLAVLSVRLERIEEKTTS